MPGAAEATRKPGRERGARGRGSPIGATSFDLEREPFHIYYSALGVAGDEAFRRRTNCPAMDVMEVWT
jgi:hypothetical protein